MTRVQFSQSRLRDEEQDRRAERPAVADAADDLGPVLLDRLARAAAVAALAAGQVDRELVGRQRQPGRHALDRDAERRPVRLAGGQEAETRPSVGARTVGAGRAGRARRRSPAARRGSSPAGSPSAERTPPARASASAAPA